MILEINKSIGGIESSIFIKELSSMYIRYIKKNNKSYNFEFEKDKIGYRYFKLKTCNTLYKFLKYEKGVHRIKRVPETENKGRIHTSTCNIDVNLDKKTKNIILNKKDLKYETFKSSGAGGQHVNKTNSAVRLKYLPENIFVTCQSERSQSKNKEIAMKILKKKLNNIKSTTLEKKKKETRKFKNFSSKRNFRIRTYNFTKNLIIDHNIKKKFFILDKVIFKEGYMSFIKNLNLLYNS
ncbi:peptide chain release factor-like protein [Candidatus Vidania fulgoroideorum]